MRKIIEGLFIVSTAVLFTLFFVIPLLMMALVSIRGSNGLTLVNYTQIITNPYYTWSLFNNVWLSL
ncbi:MAG: hypothetical protein LBD48_08680, partial [Treponema sp.]|nr:hypothetical protein [Treponema sp.]